MVNKHRYTDPKAWKRLNGHNPFALADKTLVKGGHRRRCRIISPAEEEALLAALRKCRNPEKPMFLRSLSRPGCAARRFSDCSGRGLLWSQVDLDRGVINLDPEQTKADEDRSVILLPEAVAAMRTIPVIDERLFHYKIEGFKTNSRRVLNRAGRKDIHMHDIRRTFILRVLKETTVSPVAIADMIGARSVANLQKRSIDRIRQTNMIDAGATETEEQLRSVVGHKDGQTTSRYTNMAVKAEQIVRSMPRANIARRKRPRSVSGTRHEAYGTIRVG